MKKAFSARRVPRKIGSEDEDEPARATDGGEEPSGTSLIKPSTKARKGTPLRASFNPDDADDEQTGPAGIRPPKRSNLSRLAIQRNASQRSSLLPSNLPTRSADEDEDRPSYNAASLQELKESTPSTPRDLTTDASMSDVDEMASGTQALDITSKFGTSLSRYQQPSAIPSAAEIAEKKARRARLAKEQAAEEYISLDPDDPDLDNEDEDDPNVMRDDYGRLVLKPKDKYNEAESRLTHDDEDMMENFDEFTEADGKIVMGRKAEAEAAKRRKADMAAQIAAAEGGAASDSDSDASERARNEAFEAAQTRHGTYGSKSTSADPYADVRPKTPPVISPLPTLDGVIERLRKQVAELQSGRMQRLQEMEALQREKIRLGEEEIRIQRALRETAEKFQQLRAERGIAEPRSDGVDGTEASTSVDLVNVASRLVGGPPDSGPWDSGASTDVENAGEVRGGLGFGMSRGDLDDWGMGSTANGSRDDDDG
ncbi:nineteen complex-related protein 2-domain-containing protein [Neohortaea acidophila]|uniref:Nineteen complex-related protein 2-domain-containing protein n=1 Tax=Neohortaea acidophila TaxID=245834 RepID=A0A6A6Q064_9PEZI|nr:nineteen complex-related protein 2-domain-containing protein [Neohortaea acidophila]KAF2485369.1 nineteen complex-related protein 2-domain-containing protein [Neohortaea acidophila]